MIDRLSFTNLSFAFDEVTPVFEDVTAQLPFGENVWIQGANGSGKSAFLKILAGLAVPTSGIFSINDKVVNEMSFEEFLPYRMKIGYSFDYGGLLANRTIRENLLLPLQYHGLASADDAEKWVAAILARFHLTAYSARRPAAVSGSVRKTAILARSLILKPEVLLLDDPFTGLDRVGVTALLELVDEHRKNHGLKHVFFSSRGESVSNRLATTSLFIDQMKIITESALTERKATGS